MSQYDTYSREDLLKKIEELEKQLQTFSGMNQENKASCFPSSYKEKYATKILNALPDLLCVIDHNGVHIDIVSSEKTCNIPGNADELRGKNIKEFLPDEAYQCIKKNLDKSISTQSVSIGYHSLNVDGLVHHYENRVIPLSEKTVLSIFRDITAEIKLQNKLEMITSAVNNSTEEIFAANPEGDMLFANKQFIVHYGLTEDVSQYKIYDIYPETDRIIWEEHVTSIRKQGGSKKFTTRHRNVNGEIVPLEIATFIIPGHHNQEIIWSSARNISERIQQQSKINELNSLMTNILENVPAYLFVKDTENEFRYLYWNRAFELFSHISASKVIGHRDEDFFPNPEDAAKFKKDDLELLEKGTQIELQEEYTAATGERRTVNTIKLLIPQENKAPLLMGISWDITELKKTEQQLIEARIKAEESDRLKSAFLANMSHEIRTPLNAIVGFSELVACAENEDDRQKYFNIVEKNTELLLQLINDILDLSKIEAGILEFIERPVDIGDLCQNLLESLSAKTPSSVLLIYDRNLENIVTVTDNNRLIQVISNLISNSQKFTQKGEIHFGFTLKKNIIEFYVKDSGAGIPADKIDQIFNRFIKLNNFVQGSGLGLAICKMIIKHLNGKIWVESIENKGTTFYFTLPYIPSETTIKSVQDNRVFPTTEIGQKKKILIAEDVDSNFKLIQALLEKKYIISRAHNGREALELFDKESPSLILMDIKMDDMDGLTTTRHIRLISPQIPIVAITAYAFETDRDKAIEAGCNDFLVKPLSAASLLSTIEKYI